MPDKQESPFDDHLGREVLKSLEELMDVINRCESEEIQKITYKWRHEKGVPNLIRSLVKVDSIITSTLTPPQGGPSLKKEEKSFSPKAAMPAMEKNPFSIQENECEGKSAILDFDSNKQPPLLLFPKLPESNDDPRSEEEIGEKPLAENNPPPASHNHVAQMIIGNRGEKEDKKSYVRGPYRSYTKEMKERVVEMFEQKGMPVSQISKNFGIPIKNIKRWCEQGVDRKEGAGRKRLDPLMQDELYKRIIELQPEGGKLSIEEIREKALSLSTVPDFKASRGWVINFMERYNLIGRFNLY